VYYNIIIHFGIIPPQYQYTYIYTNKKIYKHLYHNMLTAAHVIKYYYPAIAYTFTLAPPHGPSRSLIPSSNLLYRTGTQRVAYVYYIIIIAVSCQCEDRANHIFFIIIYNNICSLVYASSVGLERHAAASIIIYCLFIYTQYT